MLIKSFKLFESSSDIDVICKQFNIINYSINSDGSIDVDGNVDLTDMNLTKLPLKFRHVSGDFHCPYNQLTSLEGCPQTIGGYFTCYNNQITSLEGCPESIGGNFYCNSNQLISLKGCPESIGGGFYCHNNQLTSLEGCPTSISEGFYCNNNQIKDFGSRYFKFNDFYCEYNPIAEIYDLNRCQEFIEYLIEYDVIRDGNKIVKQRLIQALEDSNGKLRNVYRFKNYELV